jgi:hypothetical protein
MFIPGKHLDAHRHRRPVGLVQRANLPQHAVDAVADAQETRLRLEVDIGRIVLDGVGQDRVDQANNRLAVLVGGRLQAAKIDLAGFDFVQDAVDRQFMAVVLVDRAIDLGLAGEQGVDLDFVSGQPTNPVQRDDVVDIGDGHRQAQVFRVVVERQHMVALGEVARDEFQRRRIDNRIRQIDALFAEAFRERVAQRRFRDKAERDQQLPDRLIRLHLLQQGNSQLILAEDALADQDLTQGSRMRIEAGSVHERRARQSGCRNPCKLPELRLQFKNALPGSVPVEGATPRFGGTQRHPVVLHCQFVLTEVIKADGQVEEEIGVVGFQRIGLKVNLLRPRSSGPAGHRRCPAQTCDGGRNRPGWPAGSSNGSRTGPHRSARAG